MGRILLLGDSLGMPTGPDGLRYEDTYPYLLKLKLCEHEVISRHRRTNDTDKQLKEQCIFDDIEMINPDIMVVHLGIVDSAPRVFSRTEKAIVKMLPLIIRYPLLRFVSKNRYKLTKIFKKKYVNVDKYKKNMETFESISKRIHSKLIYIEIIYTNKTTEKKSYRINDSIRKYNTVLLNVSQKYNRSIVRYNYPNNYIMDDGIHLNKDGSKFVADRLEEIISSYKHD